MKNLKALVIVAILIFVGLLYMRSENSPSENGGTGNAQFAKNTAPKSALDADHSDVQSMQYAYTGNWAKNAPYNPPSNSFAFQQPVNSRNQVAQNKKDDKKKTKKTAAKKKVVKFYKGKSRYGRSFSGNTSADEDLNYNGNFYGGNNAQPAQPGNNDDDDKKLSAQEYLVLVMQAKNFDRLLSDLRAGKTTISVFYEVVTTVLAMQNQDALKVSAYQALGQLPSAKSFELIASHKSRETSPTVTAAAQTALNVYMTSPNYLGILTQELGNSNTQVRIIASQGINQIVSQIMLSMGQGNGTGNGGMVYTQQFITQLRTRLQPTLSALNRYLQGSNLDSQVAASFTTTRDTLSRFLS
jgi:hypothetical protein